MSTYSFEEPIRFHLVKVKGAVKTGADAYRAVLEHNGLSARATLEELARDTNIPEHQLRYFGTAILNSLISNTLRDGRSRNFEGFVTTRLDITGKFDRIDEPFDPKKHACALSLSPGPHAADYRRKSPPVNETKPPRGRFDYITYPGGEKGFVKIGEPIEIYGHDLRLSCENGYMMLTTYDKSSREGFGSCAMCSTLTTPNDMKILENSDSYVKLGWPKRFTLEKLRDQETVKLHFVDCRGLKESHDSFSRPATILR